MDNNTKNKKQFKVGCGIIAAIIIAIIILFIIIFAILVEQSGVKMSNELDDYVYEYFEDHDILKDDEEIIAYFDNTYMMDGSEAAILTDNRVLYIKKNRRTSIYFNNIDTVIHSFNDFSGDIINIKCFKGKPMKIEISDGHNGDIFYDALMDLWKDYQEMEP